MKKTYKFNDKDLARVESFLDDVLNVKTGIKSLFKVERLPDDLVEIDIDDRAVEFLLDADHDCKISADDGCAYCGMLFELGLIPDVYFEQEEQ